MRVQMLLSSLAALLLCALLPSPASAQTLSIGSAEVRRGGTVDIPVQFEPGAEAAVGFQLRVVYDPLVFDAPTCLPQPFVGCAVDHAAGLVSMIYVDNNLQPLTAQTFVDIRFQVPRSTRRGTRVELGANDTLFADADAQLVPFTIYTGRIDVR